MTSEDAKEILYTRAKDLVATRLKDYWTTNLEDGSGLLAPLREKIQASAKDEQILEFVTSSQPTPHAMLERENDPNNKWISLVGGGVNANGKNGPDSLLNIAIEILGGTEALQNTAQERANGKNETTISVIIDPRTNLAADIVLARGFDSQGADPHKFVPQMLNVSAPTSRVLEDGRILHPAAELVGQAIRQVVASKK